MTIFVDDVRHQFGNMVMCHCWSNSSVNELLHFVRLIGVQTKWIQGHPSLSFGKHKNASWVHFDITLSKKKLALQNGAVLTDKYGPSDHVARLDLKYARLAKDQKAIEYACRKLSMIATARGVRAKIEKDDNNELGANEGKVGGGRKRMEIQRVRGKLRAVRNRTREQR